MFRDYGIFVITQGFEKGFKRALPTIGHGDVSRQIFPSVFPREL